MPSLKEETTDNRKSALTTAYQEVCKGYHAIDNFRARLLGFLPLASGAGVFLLLGPKFLGQSQSGGEIAPAVLLAVGLFGFAVTLGLFFHEFRGVNYCRSLIEAGKNLEDQLQTLANEEAHKPTEIEITGFFKSRPPR